MEPMDLFGLYIYVPVNGKSLSKFFNTYCENSLELELEKDIFHVNLKNPSKDNRVWGGTISDIENGPFDEFYKFKSNSIFYTDTVFLELENEEVLNFQDIWFQNFFNLIKYLRDVDFPHYVVSEHSVFDENNIGGLDSEGKLTLGNINYIGLYKALYNKK
jgi:hypothetical protein